jgi:E3 ubiquitin-protein ligase MARCH6
VEIAEPYFALLGREVRLHAMQMHATWTRLALGHGPMERTFAVALGYAVVALLLSLYLNILTVGNVRSAGKAVRNAVRQQLLIVKVRLVFSRFDGAF